VNIWLLAAVEATIAGFGLAAFFYAESPLLAGVAAVSAALLGISKPIQDAVKRRRLEAYQDEQHEKSLQLVDDQSTELVDSLAEPPLPHFPTVAILLSQDKDSAPVQVELYVKAAAAIESETSDADSLLAALEDRDAPGEIVTYLKGLRALHRGNTEAAAVLFWSAAQQRPDWINPWVGWATAAYVEGEWDEICDGHPHATGVDLAPYGPGDESTFIALSEEERAELVEQFQRCAETLGSYYSLAQLARSKRLMTDWQLAYKQAA